MDKQQSSSSSSSGKMRKNRKKIELNFDEMDRQNYLSGLYGCKKQRKQRANEQLNRDMKAELKRLKEEKKNKMIEMMDEMRKAANEQMVQDELNTVKYEMDEQTVEIKSIDLIPEKIPIHHKTIDTDGGGGGGGHDRTTTKPEQNKCRKGIKKRRRHK